MIMYQFYVFQRLDCIVCTGFVLFFRVTLASNWKRAACF